MVIVAFVVVSVFWDSGVEVGGVKYGSLKISVGALGLYFTYRTCLRDWTERIRLE